MFKSQNELYALPDLESLSYNVAILVIIDISKLSLFFSLSSPLNRSQVN